MLYVAFACIYRISTKRRNNLIYFPRGEQAFFSDLDTDVRYAILDLWSLPFSREATRHANKVSAACSILRLFVVLFKKASLSNVTWCNEDRQNSLDPGHRSDILLSGPNMDDRHLSRLNAGWNSLSAYFPNVKQLDLILISLLPRCSRCLGLYVWGLALSIVSSAQRNKKNLHILLCSASTKAIISSEATNYISICIMSFRLNVCCFAFDHLSSL